MTDKEKILSLALYFASAEVINVIDLANIIEEEDITRQVTFFLKQALKYGPNDEGCLADIQQVESIYERLKNELS